MNIILVENYTLKLGVTFAFLIIDLNQEASLQLLYYLLSDLSQ